MTGNREGTQQRLEFGLPTVVCRTLFGRGGGVALPRDGPPSLSSL